ncbi:MAG: isoprenylcysteine carboxylmethyltransferase family protein [Rhizobiaceae bacterium]|nr:isoprenylcysteine carboxylmethyltransferase family protein [Rhizobiaceae bacterium]
MRISFMAYSIACYFIGVSALVALILFIGDIYLPVTVNKASTLAPDLSPETALFWNIILIVLWGLQHSIMADAKFKSWWTQFVPPAIERSTFVLFVGLATSGLILFWVPIPTMIWDVSGTSFGLVLLIAYFSGWAITLFASFLINHFQLFGLEQAFRLQTQTQSKRAIFVTPFLYRIVRHPMMTGILISLWCAPTMTFGRLLFNIVMTTYILAGTRHEEEGLIAELGQEYEDYQETTPMLVPSLSRKETHKTS